MGAPTASRVALAALMTLACASAGAMASCSTTDSLTWYGGAAGGGLAAARPPLCALCVWGGNSARDCWQAPPAQPGGDDPGTRWASCASLAASARGAARMPRAGGFPPMARQYTRCVALRSSAQPHRSLPDLPRKAGHASFDVRCLLRDSRQPSRVPLPSHWCRPGRPAARDSTPTLRSARLRR